VGAGLGPRRGISIRALAAAAGLSPSRVHQFVAGAGLDAVIAALGELRAAGWPAPKTRPAAGFSAVAGRRRRPDHRLLLPVLLLQVDGAALDRLASLEFPPVRRIEVDGGVPERLGLFSDLAQVQQGVGDCAERDAAFPGQVVELARVGGLQPGFSRE
jgi:hypothetical protein